MNCRTCGNRLEEGDRFCQVCGTPTGAGTYNVVGEGEPAPGGPATLDEHVERAEESSGSILAIIGAFVIASMIVAATAFAAYHVYKAVIEPNLPPAQPPAAVEPQTPVTGSAEGPQEAVGPVVGSYETATDYQLGDYFYYPTFTCTDEAYRPGIDAMNAWVSEWMQRDWNSFQQQRQELEIAHQQGNWLEEEVNDESVNCRFHVTYARDGILSGVRVDSYRVVPGPGGVFRHMYAIGKTYDLASGNEINPCEAMGLTEPELDALTHEALRRYVEKNPLGPNAKADLESYLTRLDAGGSTHFAGDPGDPVVERGLLSDACYYSLTEDGIVMHLDGSLAEYGDAIDEHMSFMDHKVYAAVFVKAWDEEACPFEPGDSYTDKVLASPRSGEITGKPDAQ